MKFAIFGNTETPSGAAFEDELLALLANYGDEVSHQLTPDTDMVISLGGDGTFLHAAAAVGAAGIPIVGINTGHLGFLADVRTDETVAFLKALHEGHYELRSRSVLQTDILPPAELAGMEKAEPFAKENTVSSIADSTVSTADAITPTVGNVSSPAAVRLFSLNEVAVTKHDSAAMISIHIHVDDERLTTCHSDGLLIATPTGSTAYSLSAGGPIIHPQSDVMLLTAVAPHSLNMRPIIISDDKVVELVVDSRSGHFLVAVDGQSRNCPAGTRLLIRKAPYRINVVKQQQSTWFGTLREKMNWGI